MKKYYFVTVEWVGYEHCSYWSYLVAANSPRHARKVDHIHSPNKQSQRIVFVERFHCFGNERLEKALIRLQEWSDWDTVLVQAYEFGRKYSSQPLFQLQSMIAEVQKYCRLTPLSAAELLGRDREVVRLFELVYLQARRVCQHPR